MTSLSSDCLHALALGLLGCASLDDVLARAPALLQAALGVERASLVTGVTGALSAPAGAPATLRLPLLHDGRALGAVDLYLAGDACWNAARRARAEQAAQLVAAAAAAQSANGALRDEAAELRTDVIATLSHDMRTPLASIKGYASALQLEEVEWDSATRREFLRAIEEESDHLNALITDILDSAAIEAGALPIEPEPVLLARLIRRVVERFSHRNEQHRFVVTLPEELAIVIADAQRIEQVLTNLIDNAVKYSPGGGAVIVRAESRPDDVLVQVIDQGIGIAPEDIAKLFERFFRARSRASAAVTGTGLGLPISDAIVRAHGGRIWAESALGRGTTFSFTIPRDPTLERQLHADE